MQFVSSFLKSIWESARLRVVCVNSSFFKNCVVFSSNGQFYTSYFLGIDYTKKEFHARNLNLLVDGSALWIACGVCKIAYVGVIHFLSPFRNVFLLLCDSKFQFNFG